jgi:hypothetical protein
MALVTDTVCSGMGINEMGRNKMSRRVKPVLILIFTLVMVLSCVVVAQAKDSSGSTDISNEAVDSITISGTKEDGSVNPYVDFSVTVDFSEDDENGTQKSGLDIESGDTITVSWTAPDGVTFKGYSNTITLYQDGDSSKTALGTAEVTEDGVTITFNDNVTNLQHVKGSVTFKIQNSGNTTSESGGTGTITSGNITTEITVNPSTGSGLVGFGSKGGSYSTDGSNKIDWTIWINKEAQSNLTGNIVITDTLPETETFDSFIGYSHRTGGTWSWAVDTLDEFNQNGRSFEYDEETKTITITIPASELNGDTGLVHFYTTTTAEAGETVSNSVTMKYTETNDGTSEPIEKDYTGSVTVPSSSGTISGVPKGTIQISKVVNGTTDPIAGIIFHVYKVNSSSDHTRVSGWYNGADYAEITTNKDGIASIANLTDGYYELVEVKDKLPNWIATSDIESVYVELSGTAGTSVTVPNSVKTGEITATKKWTQHDGTTADTSDHPTVYFKLYRSVNGGDAKAVDGADIKAVQTASGASSAEVKWSDLPLYDNSGNEYTYSVKEVDADGNDYTPSGYSKTENGLTVTNSKDVANTDITATKNWTLSDGTTADTSDHPTIYFKLYRSVSGGDEEAVEGAEIKTVETASGESSAEVTWSNLPETNSAGEEYTYSVKEVDADGNSYTPDGYIKTEDGLTVTNSSTGSTTSQESNDSPDDETTTTEESSGSTNKSSSGGSKNSSTSSDSGTTDNDTVRTGDTSSLGLWMALLAVSAAVLAVIGYRRHRKNIR